MICGANVRAKGAARVDHIQTIKSRPDLALEISNLRTLCAPCDNKRHINERNGKQIPITGPDGWPLP